jgi:hypothetical protein
MDLWLLLTFFFFFFFLFLRRQIASLDDNADVVGKVADFGLSQQVSVSFMFLYFLVCKFLVNNILC